MSKIVMNGGWPCTMPSPQTPSNIRILMEKRDTLLTELDALRNKVIGLSIAIDIVAEELVASGIETEGRDAEDRHGAEHESPAPKGDAQTPPEDHSQ